ncbi:hypothetical protein KIN20_033735 [Parelaphostrongylus tenuis]|uniref:Uncharacterized protein n=1 Tax=Parelaphostrongylus tenuis TaxID=148309 RepID=A0AAD5WIP0_PARTN|nr:hypothetical protein KIN20_020474 [Parelaphostrongylus tenuis]KAJ1371737.1 hypothetical protein KIN20_033735 [Parelaphostrongylus tenuis]
MNSYTSRLSDKTTEMAAFYTCALFRLGRHAWVSNENLNPFLVVLIPSKYRNTPIHHQVYQKANELVTHFDIHATLMDILKLQPEAGFSDTSYRELTPLSKGSSLFERMARSEKLPYTANSIRILYMSIQQNRCDVSLNKICVRSEHFLPQSVENLL